jgi:hypothetical protein
MSRLTIPQQRQLVKLAAEALNGVQQVPTPESDMRQQDTHEQSLQFQDEKQELEIQKMQMEMEMEQRKLEMELRHAEQEFALKQQIAQQDAQTKGMLAQMKVDTEQQKAQAAAGEGMGEAPPQFGANPIDYTMNLGAPPEEKQATAYPDYQFDPSQVNRKYPGLTEQAILPAAGGGLLGLAGGHIFPGDVARDLRDKAAILENTTADDLLPHLSSAKKKKIIEEAIEAAGKMKAQALGANWKRYLFGAGMGTLGGLAAHSTFGGK